MRILLAILLLFMMSGCEADTEDGPCYTKKGRTRVMIALRRCKAKSLLRIA